MDLIPGKRDSPHLCAAGSAAVSAALGGQDACAPIQMGTVPFFLLAHLARFRLLRGFSTLRESVILGVGGMRIGRLQQRPDGHRDDCVCSEAMFPSLNLDHDLFKSLWPSNHRDWTPEQAVLARGRDSGEPRDGPQHPRLSLAESRRLRPLPTTIRLSIWTS